jgi:hypothetical protein
VERTKTGHGHHQAGSITVVDLIRRTADPVRIPSIDETTTDTFVEDLLGPSIEDDLPRGRMARAAKLVGLAVGSAVLCGSVVAASTLAQHRTPRTTVPVAATLPLTGVDVLRPDALRAQLDSATTAAPAAASTALTTTARHVAAISRSRPSPVVTARPATMLTTTQPTILSETPESAQTVVREFYQLVAASPSAAADLLAPSLLHDATGFVRSWGSTRLVRVESLTTEPNGLVRAVVQILQPDQTWLQVTELLHVHAGVPSVIDGAELLSEQHG